MNLLFSCVGRRGYIADYFRPHLEPGDRIVGTGNTPWTPGFHSCDRAYVLPDIDADGYLGAVLDLCAQEDIGAVLSFSDPDVRAIARVRQEFADRGACPLFPSAEVVEVTADKYRTQAFLRRHGIPTPATVTSLAAARNLLFPLYVKPRHGSASTQVYLARDARELEFFFDYGPDMLIQEAIAGEELNIQLCTDFDGRPVGLCTLRKHAMRQGETDQAETIHDGAAIELGLRLADVLAAVGPLDIDVIRRDDGTLFVLEVNTRFGGAYPIAHLAGADFPRLLLELATDGKVAEPDLGFAGGVVMMKRLEAIGGPSGPFFEDALGLQR